MAEHSSSRSAPRPEVVAARAAAQALRARLALAPTAPLPCALTLAEQHLALNVVLTPLPEGCSGFYLPASHAPVVVVESTQPVPRQRFTLVHEIGHHQLGHGLAARLHELAPPPAPATAVAPAPASHYAVRRSTDPNERAANTFAAELLAPDAGVAEVYADWDDPDPLDRAVRLSAHFGLSALAAVVKQEFHGFLAAPQIANLKTRLRTGEHFARYEALGLSQIDDALQRHADAGGGLRAAPAARASIARLRADADALFARSKA